MTHRCSTHRIVCVCVGCVSTYRSSRSSCIEYRELSKSDRIAFLHTTRRYRLLGIDFDSFFSSFPPFPSSSLSLTSIEIATEKGESTFVLSRWITMTIIDVLSFGRNLIRALGYLDSRFPARALGSWVMIPIVTDPKRTHKLHAAKMASGSMWDDSVGR